MKRILFAAIAAFLLTSCSQKESSQTDSSALSDSDIAPALEDTLVSTPDAVPLHFGKTLWKDVRMVHKPAGATVEYDVRYADAGPEALVSSINQWVTSRFELMTSVSPETLPEAVRKGAEEMLRKDAAEIEETLDPESDASMFQYERSYKVRVEYLTAEYVTLSSQFYHYCGGAHGVTLVDHATFRLADGHQMDWELLKGMDRADIKRAIRKGLMGYFEVKTDAELMAALLLFDEPDIPLPAAPPFLTKNGVEVIYQQYEIAPYAAGLPSCVVSPKPVLGK